MTDASTTEMQGAAFSPTPLSEFIDTPVPNPRWAIEGVWPLHASGVIAGKPKGGKSSIAAELAISLWSGTRMFGPGTSFPAMVTGEPVLLIQQENTSARVQRDLQRIMAVRGLGEIETLSLPADDGATVEHEVFDERFDITEELPAFEILSQKGFDLTRTIDRDWLTSYIAERGFRYLILDPLYMMVGGTKISDGGDELRPILTWLTTLKERLGCAAILTHHLSDKGDRDGAAALLGTTYLHAWYEAALFTKRSDAGIFTITADSMRDFSTSTEYVMDGLGVGSWMFTQAAQNQIDETGRKAPKMAEKEIRKARLRELRAEHGDEWTTAQYAEALRTTDRTVRNYLTEIADEDNDAA
jgi:hypothetical protein